MDSGFYAACTGLLAKTDALELTANNMANSSTTGYKRQMEFYRSLEASTGSHSLSSVNKAVNDYGVLGGTAVDMKSGEFEKTGNDLDLAMEGSGFFTVKTPAGIRYTRNGSFHTDTAGRLLTATGDPVMGEQGPVELPSGTITISSDGTISQGGAVVATMKLVTFKPGTSLAAEGNSYYQAPAGSEIPAEDPRLSQGMLESSNQNPVVGAVSLIALQRHSQLLEQALSIFHSVFNNAPAQDLSRVS
ncbi:MAG: flagellar basal-body rod protein FlgF [Acidobacteriota bacterium]|nr:flagellar basal-body rod protein FlgF [Acidobacteriota bacterium]